MLSKTIFIIFDISEKNNNSSNNIIII